MNRSAKVAISLPEHMLKAIEKERRASGESRSQFFRRAAEELLKQENESKKIEAFVRGYAATPETAEEIEAAHQSAVKLISQEPW